MGRRSRYGSAHLMIADSWLLSSSFRDSFADLMPRAEHRSRWQPPSFRFEFTAQWPTPGRKVCRVNAHQLVNGLGGRQVVADRADPAQPLYQNGHLPVGMSLDKPLKSPELDDMEVGLIHLPGIVQVYGDPARSDQYPSPLQRQWCI